jgi:hypothetical protein
MTVTRVWVSPAFWFTCYVNEVSYLVGKPFIPLSFLSEKLCWSVLEISEDAHLFSVVENSILFFYSTRFARSVLMCGCILQMSKTGAEEEGVLSRSKQLNRMRYPSNSSCRPAPDVHRADVSDADSCSSGHRSDFGRHSAAVVAAATTSASNASDAQGQAC